MRRESDLDVVIGRLHPMLQTLAYAGVCIVTGTYILQRFANVFIPLVLAGMVVALLDPLVWKIEIALTFCFQGKRRSESLLSRQTLQKGTKFRCFAAFQTVVFLGFFVWLIGVALTRSQAGFRLEPYRVGFAQLQNATVQIVDNMVLDKLEEIDPALKDNSYVSSFEKNPMVILKLFFDFAQSEAKNNASVVVNEAMYFAGVSVMFLLYTFLWLLEPLDPDSRVASEVAKVFHTVRRYFFVKAIINLGVSFVIGAWLIYFLPDLYFVIAFISFWLLFIPAIGDFLPFLAPAPLILLNSDLGTPWNRILFCIIAESGMLAIHALRQVGEPKLLGKCAGLPERTRAPSQESLIAENRQSNLENDNHLHPVVILFAVNVAGEIWGAFGMLISVPVLWCVMAIFDDAETKRTFRKYTHASEPAL